MKNIFIWIFVCFIVVYSASATVLLQTGTSTIDNDVNGFGTPVELQGYWFNSTATGTIGNAELYITEKGGGDFNFSCGLYGYDDTTETPNTSIFLGQWTYFPNATLGSLNSTDEMNASIVSGEEYYFICYSPSNYVRLGETNVGSVQHEYYCSTPIYPNPSNPASCNGWLGLGGIVDDLNIIFYSSEVIPPDTTLPVITLVSPADTSVIYGNESPINVSINFNATDDVAIDKLWYDNGSANISYTAVTTVLLSEGVYTYVFYANDTSGNTANASTTFITSVYVPSDIYQAIEDTNNALTNMMVILIVIALICGLMAFMIPDDNARAVVGVVIIIIAIIILGISLKMLNVL